MHLLAQILRTVSLALLFGGSSAVVFTAVSLVRMGVAQGLTPVEAAFNNAPIFTNYARVAFGAGVFLLLGEGLDFAARRRITALTVAQYAASFLCVLTAVVFAFGLVPPMEELLPVIRTDEAAHRQFHQLHELSRIVFGGTILFALASLLLPIFQTPRPPVNSQQEGG